MSRCTRSQALRLLIALGLPLASLHSTPAERPEGRSDNNSSAAAIARSVKTLTLEQCLQLAFERNHRRPASQFELAMAEAQHRQALAGYWPQFSAKAGYERLDQPLNFIFPGSTIQVPAQSISMPASTVMVTVPANAFMPGFPPSDLQMPVNYPAQTINTPAQAFSAPKQNVTVLDNNLLSGSLEMKWLLWDGGMRHGYREQSAGLVEMMRQAARRTDLEIADEVKRYYWGAVLAHQLHQLGADTLARMETTLRLTESLYKNGAGRVTKADYLDNTVMVESIRAMVAQLEKNEVMAEAALANSAGMPATASVQPSSSGIPFQPQAAALDAMVSTAYEFNPDWGKLEAALRSAQGVVTTEHSAYYPKLAITGELHRWWNGGLETGMATPQNMAGWSLGMGVEIPVFNGFLTKNKVEEALARVNQLKQNRILLQEGIGLQVKDIMTGLDATAKEAEATRRAMEAAQENRDLNERAYENELVDTEKVIRTQLVEALMSAQHFKALYDYAALQSQLNLVVGKEVMSSIEGPPK